MLMSILLTWKPACPFHFGRGFCPTVDIPLVRKSLGYPTKFKENSRPLKTITIHDAWTVVNIQYLDDLLHRVMGLGALGQATPVHKFCFIPERGAHVKAIENALKTDAGGLRVLTRIINGTLLKDIHGVRLTV
jgi:hypothetical protein